MNNQAKVLKFDFEDQSTFRIVNMFRMLADETRLKVVYALFLNDKMSVGNVATFAGCTIATASHHLRQMNLLKHVEATREGKSILYSLKDEDLRRIVTTAFLK